MSYSVADPYAGCFTEEYVKYCHWYIANLGRLLDDNSALRAPCGIISDYAQPSLVEYASMVFGKSTIAEMWRIHYACNGHVNVIAPFSHRRPAGARCVCISIDYLDNIARLTSRLDIGDLDCVTPIILRTYGNPEHRGNAYDYELTQAKLKRRFECVNDKQFPKLAADLACVMRAACGKFMDDSAYTVFAKS